MIWKRTLQELKSSNLIQLCHTKKQLLQHLTLFACQNHQTSTTDFMPKLNHSTKISQMPLKRDKLHQKMIQSKELNHWMRIMIGIRMMPLEFGPSDQKTLVPTSLWIRLQVFNTWMNWENQWNLLGNGQQRKDPYVKKIKEVSESTLWIVFSMLMPSTEEVVKLFQLQEDCIMHVNWPLNQDSKSQSS